MYSTLAAIAFLGSLAWLWVDSLRARELASGVAKRFCENEGLQFLDDTVALAGLRPAVAFGRPVLRRVYAFEFSRIGNDRHGGLVTLVGARVETLYIEPPAPGVIESSDGRVVDLATRRARLHKDATSPP